MAKMLIGSIDLNKIDKSKIVDKDKDGKPFNNGAKYLNIVVWVNDTVDQYGNIAGIQMGMSKEERESGVKPTYIGNLKNIQGQNMQSTPLDEVAQSDDSDNLPF